MRNYKSLFAYVGGALVLALAYFASPMSREAVWQIFPGLEAMAQADPLATAMVFLIASTLFAFLAFPSMPMIYMAAGFYMNGIVGSIIVLLGSAIGGLGAFLFYRRHIQARPSGPMNEHSTTKIWLTLLGLRLSPIVPAPLVNFFAAIFRVSPVQYLTTTVLGSAPLILFYVQIGQQGHQFLSGEVLHWRQFSAYVVILILSTLLSAMGPWKSVLNKLRQLKESSASKTLPMQPASRP